MKIVTFGEMLLRLSPNGFKRFRQTDRFETWFGGAEANVAAALAQWGMQSAFVSKMPDHEIGQGAIDSLRKFGVDPSQIVRGGDRIGIYFCEKGASQRPSKVIYDRKHSAFATAARGDFDWNCILDGADWFHITGITPALGGEIPDICRDALEICRERKIKVSCDLNYRSTLWSREQARKILTPFMSCISVCIANEGSVEDVFGITGEGSSPEERALNSACKLHEIFGFEKIAYTMRESVSASENGWAALLYDGSSGFISRRYCLNIVDRIGGGDAFAAGVIFGLMTGWDAQHTVEFAAAAGALKHSVEGDVLVAGLGEVEALANGDSSGRVRR